MAKFTYTESVEMHTTPCAGCGMLFGITADFEERRRKDHATFYCPVGCRNVYNQETEAEKLRREVAGLKQREAMHEDDKRQLRVARDLAETRAAKEQKARKRVETRVHAGVCPDCNRTFANMARHMSTKHGARKCEVVPLRKATP